MIHVIEANTEDFAGIPVKGCEPDLGQGKGERLGERLYPASLSAGRRGVSGPCYPAGFAKGLPWRRFRKTCAESSPAS